MAIRKRTLDLNTQDVAYRFGTQAKYDALGEYSDRTLYFCTDTKKLYRGSEDYTEMIRVSDNVPALPTGAKGILYIQPDGNGYYYDGAWKKILYATTKTVTDASTDEEIPTAKAVYTAIQDAVKDGVQLDGYATTEQLQAVEKRIDDVSTWQEF